ncbi:hypothetical protein V496_00278 [Pseudogymnoascus sp. VKM F-4515 (FW-2607)]|nr:hypothetical protein V496_00278 [Pseudogymnoascus sp. VKM F-4515 (FW-2607)]
MRDEAPVAALSHLVPDSRLLEVHVQASEQTRRIRRGRHGGDCDSGNNKHSNDGGLDLTALDYHSSLIFDNDTTGNEAAKVFAENYLLPYVHEDLQRLANMVQQVPDFPRPGVAFRHVLGISQKLAERSPNFSRRGAGRNGEGVYKTELPPGSSLHWTPWIPYQSCKYTHRSWLENARTIRQRHYQDSAFSRSSDDDERNHKANAPSSFRRDSAYQEALLSEAIVRWQNKLKIETIDWPLEPLMAFFDPDEQTAPRTFGPTPLLGSWLERLDCDREESITEPDADSEHDEGSTLGGDSSLDSRQDLTSSGFFDTLRGSMSSTNTPQPRDHLLCTRSDDNPTLATTLNQYQPSQQGYVQPTYQSRGAPGNADSTTNGLVHQFSHQNLGGAARGNQHARQPAGAQRPRTAGSTGMQQNYYSAASAPVIPQQPEFEPAPGRNPDKYGPLTHNNQKRCAQLASDFFKDSVKRARDRNLRQSEMEQRLKDPNMSQARREQTWANTGRQEGKYLRFLRTRDKPDNYKILKIIGKGAFGEVKLVQKKQDGRIYSMKSLVKTEMFKKDQLAHVRAERDILAESDSPWYEIFSEDITRFYIAEIVLAIEAVHKLGFIHRDIKPDNILLDRGGHVKLTDFGLSTGFHRLHDNSYYQQLLQRQPAPKLRDRNSEQPAPKPPPEILNGNGYSYDCDWWSLGTIMFECQIGWPPFCAEENPDTYRRILNWRTTLHFPDDIQLGAEAENLIRSLICNSENRLGRVSVDEIKAHPFFRGVDFDSLRRIRAPFEPRLTSNIDTTYFPIDEIDQTDTATHLKAAQAAGQVRDEVPEMDIPFLGYTYKRFDTFNSR